MADESHQRGLGLYPRQVCFVVDDVPAASEACRERFGWGPFYTFVTEVPEARYRDWSGAKKTEVALGMAGCVQVELIHVHAGRDAIGTYQADYGSGFQHIGIFCRSRDDAMTRLEVMGGRVDATLDHDGVRIAFIDVPSGPAMWELLEPTRPDAAGAAATQHKTARLGEEGVLEIDRATIVTEDMARTFPFYREAFGWTDAVPKPATLQIGSETYGFERVTARAGMMDLEIVMPVGGGERSADPYSAHLARGDHGLIHVGSRAGNGCEADAGPRGSWRGSGETFTFVDWAGGEGAMQVRRET